MSRLWIVAILVLLLTAASFSVTRIRFSANIYDLLPRDLPEVQGMDRLNRHFSQDRILILTLEATDAGSAEAAAASLTASLLAHPNLVSKVVRELPLEETARQSSGLVAWLWLNGDPTPFQSLLERLHPDRSAETIADSLTAIEEGFLNQETVIQSYDPLGLLRLPGALDSLTGPDRNPLTSEDGTFRVLYITGAGPPSLDYRLTAEWLEDLHALINSWQRDHSQFASIDIGMTGTPAFMATIGTSMERDLSGSLVLTTVLIALLFAIMHRRLRPLLWLVAMMLLILCAALNLGSLMVGNLSVMSAGFAAIVMGLAVDYGVILYREARSAKTVNQLRSNVGPAILWAAATTAAVFLSLNLSSLPGLAQLGNLVALGILVGAVVMLGAFAPLAAKFPAPPAMPLRPPPPNRRTGLIGTIALAVPVAAAASLALKGPPTLDPEFRPFRIHHAPAFQAWQHMKARLASQGDVTPIIVTADSNSSLVDRVEQTWRRLQTAQQSGLLMNFTLPGGLVPNRARQIANADSIRALLPERARLLREIETAGFSDEGTRLTRELFDQWQILLNELEATDQATHPTGSLAEFVMSRFHAVSPDNNEIALLGTVQPSDPANRKWIEAICDETTTVASLSTLGSALNDRIKSDLLRVFLPLIAILSLMLLLVFRSPLDLLLGLFSLLFSAAALLVLTLWSPLDWNAFNVCAIPILFGTCLDYTIHMTLALRRNNGDLAPTHASIGKALLFCGGSTAIGFGTLGLASARGLASLGQICAAGILINMIVAVYLLPRWWRWMHPQKNRP